MRNSAGKVVYDFLGRSRRIEKLRFILEIYVFQKMTWCLHSKLIIVFIFRKALLNLFLSTFNIV